MAFSNNSSDSGAISDINVTPLVDVLLVLLIIFMVTAPTVSYPIDVNLPQPTLNPPPQTSEPPPPIALRIDATGQVFWNNNPTPLTAIPGLMNETVQRDPTNQPLLEIDTNDDAEYGVLAKVLAYAKNADMKKIGFVQK
ncbi:MULTISPECIES: ExbD/TolR family protein [Lysobacter]|uniref:Biopolymer transport exbD2 protein, putative n=2 Tax=Lysobacter TaxID=68 RepID=A0A0S2DQL9_LYSEN|nr:MULTISPECIES: biopolymer transporter ExbD [Lysobacter]ALN60669.1 biopolymer transport exbD2 protein, putative [Lysobacter enzymogenes]QCW28544.1 biopolymer transporter ExbD [Lysobacter enzymogenes]QQQ01417.1 biopolymer transporter ExbD [Lysobacter enzymogenes]UZW60680.1 biopolymer transporter ExbD [Lysobacter enzymogenes]WMT04561.1 biopolymer transporter ExbD [Lysobacter yananisis]